MKISKVFSILAIVIMLLASVSNVAFALSIGNVSIESDKTGSATTSISGVGGKIIGIVQTAGTIFSVVVLVVLGIKYMMGSAEEKAEYKKTMVPYIIGAVIVLLAVNIVGWVAGAADGLFGGGNIVVT